MTNWLAGWDNKNGRAFDDLGAARAWLADKMDRRAAHLSAWPLQRRLLVIAASELRAGVFFRLQFRETISGRLWWIARDARKSQIHASNSIGSATQSVADSREPVER